MKNILKITALLISLTTANAFAADYNNAITNPPRDPYEGVEQTYYSAIANNNGFLSVGNNRGNAGESRLNSAFSSGSSASYGSGTVNTESSGKISQGFLTPGGISTKKTPKTYSKAEKAEITAKYGEEGKKLYEAMTKAIDTAKKTWKTKIDALRKEVSELTTKENEAIDTAWDDFIDQVVEAVENGKEDTLKELIDAYNTKADDIRDEYKGKKEDLQDQIKELKKDRDAAIKEIRETFMEEIEDLDPVDETDNGFGIAFNTSNASDSDSESYGIAFNPSNESSSGSKGFSLAPSTTNTGTSTEVTSESLTTSAWKAYNNKNYESTKSYARQVIDMYTDKALEQQGSLSGYAKSGKESKYWALNDVATSYFILGKTAAEENNASRAKKYFNKIVDNFGYAQCYDPDTKSYWKVKEAALEELNKL